MLQNPELAAHPRLLDAVQVGAGGPYLTVVGLLLVPFVWCVPSVTERVH
jgi:hypothetical protein